jgi:glycerate kinase
MKVLVAPDKFKGSLSAERVASAIIQGFQKSGKKFDCIALPLADGGDGTSQVLTTFNGGTLIPVRVEDPLGRTIDTEYGIDPSGTTAFIEMAGASGLALLTSTERNPLLTSTRGTGQVMCDAVARGVNQIILGIGGSATHDGGMGIANAFGARFLDASGNVLSPIGKNLSLIHSVNVNGFDTHVSNVAITVLNDVQNPLYGPEGAASVFAPQKGASSDDVKVLDEGLRHFADVLKRQFQTSIDFPGAGAGGGVGAILKALFKTRFESGIRFIMEYLRFEEQVMTVDAVITGEGSLDTQTLHGKVVSGVAEVCRRYQKPLYVVAGKNELTKSEAGALGVRGVFTLSETGESASNTMQNAYEAVKKCVYNHVSEIAAGVSS